MKMLHDVFIFLKLPKTKLLKPTKNNGIQNKGPKRTKWNPEIL